MLSPARALTGTKIDSTGLPVSVLARLWGAALAAAAAAWAVKLGVGHQHPVVMAAAVLGPYGVVYLGGTYVMGVGSIRQFLGRRR